MRNREFWLPFGISFVVYALATAVSGRDVLAHPGSVALHDVGDPLLTTAIFHWTTTHVPFTDGWWQFPIFFPTRDALAFSEHLLGLSVVATPLEWLTGSPLVAYNLTALLTTPLCGGAMFALAWYLTRNTSAAFLVGLAYAFAPYRVSQLPHIQMLGMFWAPVSLLGLHAYLDTRRARWLVLYGAAWAMQALANGYALFFFSLLVGLWVCWFVLFEGHWRVLGAIALATVVAALPLAPIVYKYLVVQQLHGLSRSVEEMQYFSADAASLLCASPLVTTWGWLQVGCGPEGQLFPGVALVLIACGGALLLAARTTAARMPRRLWIVAWVCLLIGVVYFAVIVSIVAVGPWRLALGPLRISASSLRKPLVIALPALTIALGLWWRFRRRARDTSTLNFYLATALLMWLLSLGPSIHVLGRDTHVPGLFNVLLYLPGVTGLRVPARFWMMSVLSLCVAASLVLAFVLARRSARTARLMTAALAVAVIADGWVARVPAPAVPAMPLFPETLANRLVMRLPYGDQLTDIDATYEAVIGGWTSINGYSGYWPNYHLAVVDAVRQEDGHGLFDAFRAYGDLDVIVAKHDTRLIRMVEAQPGVRPIENALVTSRYRLPRRGRVGEGLSAGGRVAVAALRSTCSAGALPLAVDGHRQSGWSCFSDAGQAQTLTVDAGRSTSVGALVMTLGPRIDVFPRELNVATSVDGVTWSPVWHGGVLAQAIRGGIASPSSLRLTSPVTPRETRYIRVEHPADRQPYYWWISELEVWSDNTGVPDNRES
jgi:hypothetical protein